MYTYPFLDFDAMNNHMNQEQIESQKKIQYIHNYLGGDFHDSKKRIIKGSVVGIVAIGGFPVELSESGLCLMGRPVSIQELLYQLQKSIGISSFMSYLNPKNKTLNEIAESTLKLGHQSVLHMLNISILVSGISVGVEHEFSSQRDIVHLSRITVAKTKAQSSPCLVLNSDKYFSAYEKIIEETEKVLSTIPGNDYETRNLLFPSAKASAIILTGSIKNMMKLVSLKAAGGKETEFIKALQHIEDALHQVFYPMIQK